MPPEAIPLSLYIHIPWCVQKCPYCDFNSHTAPQALPEETYIDALLADLQSELPHIWGRRIHTVFIGGGTPSLFSAKSMDKLLCGLRALIPLSPNTEITLEANPGTFEQERFKAYRNIGINRLSIGIQSYNTDQLKALGRIHNAEEALNAADIALTSGFDNFNLDLMFGLPKQSIDEALQDLQQAIDCKPKHLSWYQLTLEPNTLFHKHPPTLPHDDLIADMHDAGISLLAQHGYEQYEVSAYAQSGKQCLHNRNYWEFGDYIGIGAGAHGKHTTQHETGYSISRYQKHRHPRMYMEQAQLGSPQSSTTELAAKDLPFEFMLNALRLKQGVSADLFSQRTGLDINVLEQGINQATQKGLWLPSSQVADNKHGTNDQGWRFLNEAVECFL